MSKLTKREEAYLYFVILVMILLLVTMGWKVMLICFLSIGIAGQIVKFVRHWRD
jgi:predicted exporter